MRERVRIAVPSYRRSLSVNTAISLLNFQMMSLAHYQVQFCFESSPVISDLRNSIVAGFLASDDDILLMLDADMGVDPRTLMRMLLFNREVVGCIYPKHNYYWDQLTGNRAEKGSERIRYQTMQFVGQLKADDIGKVALDNGFAPADALGTGALAIRRIVFDKLIGAFPELEGKGFPLGADNEDKAKFNWGFFNPIRDQEVLGEDYSFCRRWRDGCDGQMWAEVSADLTHTSDHTFCGNYVRYLEIMEERLSAATPSN